MCTALALTGAVGAVEAVDTLRADGSLPVGVADTRPLGARFADTILAGIAGNTVGTIAVGAHVAVEPAPCVPAHTATVGSRHADAVGARGAAVLTLAAVVFGVAVVAKVASPTFVAKTQTVIALHTGAVHAQRAVVAFRPEAIDTEVAEVASPAVVAGAIALVSVEAPAMLTLGAAGAVGAKVLGRARAHELTLGDRHGALGARKARFVALLGLVVVLRTS